MRTDKDVHLAAGATGQGSFLFGRRHEAGKLGDPDGEVLEALVAGFKVLLGEERCGREKGNLFAAHHSLERGAHGDLGLAVAHVAAEEPVHGNGFFHVGLDFLAHRYLVVGFLVGKGRFKGRLPFTVFREGETLRGLAFRVEVDEPLGDVFYRLLDLVLAVFPGL